MYRIFTTQNISSNGRQMPGFRVMEEGDFVSFVKASRNPRIGTPGKRIVFCGKRGKGGKTGDFRFEFAEESKRRQKHFKSADKFFKTGKFKSAKPKTKKTSKAKKTFSFSRKRRAKKTAAKRKSAKMQTHPDLRDYELFVQVNKRIKKRNTRTGKITTIPAQGWTMARARKAARAMGFGYTKKSRHKITRIGGRKRKLYGRRRKRRVSFRGLFGNVKLISGRRRKRHLKKMSRLYGRKRRKRRLYGRKVGLSGRRRKRRAYRLRGFTSDKGSLIIGLVAGGGIAYVLKTQVWDKRKEAGSLPSFAAENPNEVFALGMVAIGLLLTFSDKIAAVKKNAKLANILKSSGLGVTVGALGLFAKDKFGGETVVPPPSMEGRLRGLRGLRGLGGRLGSLNLGSKTPRLQASNIGVGALGLKGNVYQTVNNPINVPARKISPLSGNVVSLAGNVVRLAGAANLENSTQTGLSEAEYGL